MNSRKDPEDECVAAKAQRPASEPAHPNARSGDSGAPFPHHRQAALALLIACPALSHMEAGFLGHVCVSPILTDKQRDWLAKLLRRHGLPPIAGESAAAAE